MTTLEALGWNERLAREFEPFAARGFVAARVVSEHKHIYRVAGEEREHLAVVSGGMRHRATTAVEYPAVGDWVALRIREGEPRPSIQSILTRRSRFSRKVAGDVTQEQVVAANIDTVFLAMGLDANYSLRRIERYLVTAWESGAQPVVLLTKADLCDEVDARRAEVESVASGAPVLRHQRAQRQRRRASSPVPDARAHRRHPRIIGRRKVHADQHAHRPRRAADGRTVCRRDPRPPHDGAPRADSSAGRRPDHRHAGPSRDPAVGSRRFPRDRVPRHRSALGRLPVPRLPARDRAGVRGAPGGRRGARSRPTAWTATSSCAGRRRTSRRSRTSWRMLEKKKKWKTISKAIRNIKPERK